MNPSLPYLLTLQQNMINGVYLSQLQVLRQGYLSHQRKLAEISHEHPRCTHIDTSLQKILQNRKAYHQKWKNFQITKYESNIFQQNGGQKDRIRQIRMRKNRFQQAQEEPPTATRGNYFYLRKKMEETIDQENPEIARRIVQVRGSIDMRKSNSDFWESRRVVHRLQKFPVAKRMEEYSLKKLAAGSFSLTPERDKRLYTIVKRHRTSQFE